MSPVAGCPCLSGLPFEECCRPFHLRKALPPTAERLMRARYSAYAVGDTTFLLSTWHPSTRPKTLALESNVRWYRLDVLGRTGGGMLDATGTVEFRAFFREGEHRGEQHENSAFVRLSSHWVYVDEAEPASPVTV